ncbi:MAG: aspartate aminotransferase family protein [Blastocatellia bacterium]
MNHVFPRFANIEFPVAVKGDGPYIIDREGKRYLDACGGAGISCLGHSEPTVIEAIRNQAAELAFAYTMFYTNDPAELLADDLISDAPAGLTRVFYGCGGSEQIDGTLKMARQYFVAIGQPQRTRFIARRQSYHGATMGGLSVGGHLKRREIYLPLLAGAEHISPCYAYRGRRDDETEEEYGLRVADELEEALLKVGPETVIGFVAETIVGATAGCVAPTPGYFKRVREICDRHGVLLILDEVMCGLGRTGARWACAQEGVTPDLLVVAKGLGAGYQPISATLVADKIFAAIRDTSGFFMHGHSYQAHAVACAAALAVQKVIREQNLIANARTQGELLKRALEDRFGDHPHVGDIRGRGLFLALELVKDRETKEPFDPALNLWLTVMLKGMEFGLMCYPGGGTVDGVKGDHVLLAPPFNINSSHVEEIVEKLARTLDKSMR